MVSCRFGMLLKMQFLDFLPACHDSSSSAKLDVPPHCIKVLVIDGTNVVGLICERGELVALGVVVVIRHCISKAMDDSLSDVCNRKVRALHGLAEGLGLTFILWLRGSGITCDQILVIVWSHRLKVHGSGNIQQNHGVVGRDFRRIVSSERWWHDLL